MESYSTRKQSVIAALGKMIKPEHIDVFFNNPHPLLDDQAPAELIKTPEGFKRVLNLIHGARTGSFP